MKIAVITKQFNFRGGSSHYVYELTRRMASRGHRVFIYTNKYDGRPVQGVKVVKVPVLKTGFFVKTMSFAWLSEWMARREGFDIIQGHGDNIRQDILSVQNCYLATKLSQGIKTGPLNPNAIIEKKQVTKGNYKKIVTPSAMVKRDIVRFYSVPPRDISVIPLGVDSEHYHPRNRINDAGTLRKMMKITEDAEVILFISSGDFANRGLDNLMRAVSSLFSQGRTKIKLVVVGGDKVAGFYRPFAEKLGIARHTFFMPFTPEIERCYAMGDILVFPTHYDSFGQVVSEAMASGLPVIVSSRAGVSELIKDGDEGIILKDPADPLEIAGALRLLLDNPVKKKSMGKRARLLAATLSWDRVAQSTMEVYEEIGNWKLET